MAFDSDNENLQELSIIITDKIRSVDRKWWYALFMSFVLCIPVYFLARSFFVNLQVASHTFPAYIYVDTTKVPLTVTDKKIFRLGGNAYAGFFKIKNSSNYDWGVPNQSYTVSFTTTAGTEVTPKITKTTFVLPSSEKIVVIPRFTAEAEPTVMNVNLGASQFVLKPQRPDPNLSIEKINLADVAGQLTVSAEVKNKTPFTIKQIGLTAVLYDSSGNIVGANYTSVGNVLYTENRSFQFSWPNHPNAIRAEIIPDINLYDPSIYQLPPGTPQFDATDNTTQ